MAFIVEVKPPMNVAPGEPASDTWGPAFNHWGPDFKHDGTDTALPAHALGVDITKLSVFESEPAAEAFARMLLWLAMSPSQPHPEPREVRVRKLTK